MRHAAILSLLVMQGHMRLHTTFLDNREVDPQKIHIRIRLRTVNQLFFYSLIHIFSINEPLSYNHPDYR